MQTTKLKVLRKSFLSQTIGKIILSSYRPVVYMLGVGCLSMPLQYALAEDAMEADKASPTQIQDQPSENFVQAIDVDLQDMLEADQEIIEAARLAQELQNGTVIDPVIVESNQDVPMTNEITVLGEDLMSWDDNEKEIAAFLKEPLQTIDTEALLTSEKK